MTFEPPIRFDYVTVLIDAVPVESRNALFMRLKRLYLKRGGRLILSCYPPGAFLLGPRAFEAEPAAAILRGVGFEPIGEAEVIDPGTVWLGFGTGCTNQDNRDVRRAMSAY